MLSPAVARKAIDRAYFQGCLRCQEIGQVPRKAQYLGVPRKSKKRRRPASDVRDIAAAYEFIDRLKRAPRSSSPGERAWGRRTKAELDRLDREIALALAQKRR